MSVWRSSASPDSPQLLRRHLDRGRACRRRCAPASSAPCRWHVCRAHPRTTTSVKVPPVSTEMRYPIDRSLALPVVDDGNCSPALRPNSPIFRAVLSAEYGQLCMRRRCFKRKLFARSRVTNTHTFSAAARSRSRPPCRRSRASLPGAPISIRPERQAGRRHRDWNRDDRPTERRKRHDEARVAGLHAGRRHVRRGGKDERVEISSRRPESLAAASRAPQASS